MRRVVGVHVLKNIMIPIVTVIGLEFGIDHRLRHRHRDDLRLARHGQADHRFDQRARPAGDRRLPAGHRDFMFILINLVVDVLYSVARPAGPARPRRKDSAVGDRRPSARPDRQPGAARRIETPFRRFVADFAESRLAVVGARARSRSSCSSPLFAPLISPQNPYDLCASSTSWTARCRRAAPPPRVSPTGSAPTTRAATCCRRSSTACASARRRRGERRHRARHRHAVGLLAAYSGGRIEALIMRIVDIQLSLPGHPGGADPAGRARAGAGKIVIALVAVQWAYYARTVRGAALVERRKEYIEAARCLALGHRAHRLPPPAAQLPAAADRGRRGAGRRTRSRSRRRCPSSASACRSPSRRSAC